MTEFMFVQLFVSLLLLSSSLLFKKAANANINSVFGYRTKGSSRNNEAWQLANLLCFKYMIIIALANIIVALLVLSLVNFEMITYEDNFLYLIAIQLIISMLILYFKIEVKLKENNDL